MARNETTVGFEVYPTEVEQVVEPTVEVVVEPTVEVVGPLKLSVKEFAALHKVDYPTAQGFIKFLQAKGIVEQVGSRKTAAGRGKPTNLYQIPTSVTLKVA